MHGHACRGRLYRIASEQLATFFCALSFSDNVADGVADGARGLS